MRTKNAMLNAISSIGVQIILLIFGLIMPRLIIMTYGSEVNGLTSTIRQILQLLNLLQAGAVGASIYALYKPVANKDYVLIKKIMLVSKKYFWKLGMVFLGLLIVVAPIIAFYKKTTGLSFIEILISILILGISTATYFLFVSLHDILFSAFQKRYLLTIGALFEKLLYYLLLFLIIEFKLYFIFIYIAVLLGSLAKLILLNYLYRKEFNETFDNIIINEDEKQVKIENKGYLLVNQISVQAIESAPIIFIASFYNFYAVSVYSVYNLILLMGKMVINTIQLSVSAILGNYVVSESDENIKKIFNLLQFIFFLVGTFFAACTSLLLKNFILVYTNNITDANYEQPYLVLFVIIYLLVLSQYMPYFLLSNVYGIFKETYLQAAFTAIIGIIIALVLCKIKFYYVGFGLIFYYIISFFYRVLMLYKNVGWFKIRKGFTRLVFSIFFVYFLSVERQCFFFLNIVPNWTNWFFLAIKVSTLVAGFLIIYSLLFERKEIRQLFLYFKKLIKRKR